MNQEIKDMLEEPGIYAITVPGAAGFSRVEVTWDGTVYQLTPEGKRDGVLSRTGWHPHAFVEKVQ